MSRESNHVPSPAKKSMRRRPATPGAGRSVSTTTSASGRGGSSFEQPAAEAPRHAHAQTQPPNKPAGVLDPARRMAAEIRPRTSAGAFGGGGLAAAHFEPVAAVDGLDVENLAPGDPQDALHGRGHVLVHSVGELDDDDGALAWCPDESACDGPRALPELAQHHVHVTKSSIARRRVYCASELPRRVCRNCPELHAKGPAEGPPASQRADVLAGASAMHPHDPSQDEPRPSAASGWIEVVCGSMFSGKTEELLRRIKRARLARQRVQLFKPRVDDRYDALKVVSHE